MNNEDWFKIKHYCHIGEPLLGDKSRKFIYSYVKNKECIAHHSFFPLIRKCALKNKYKLKKIKGKTIKYKTTKCRYLCYATHIDAAIYSYYAYKLSMLYDEYIKEHNLSDCVIAYRRIKDKNNHGKCNIDFAKDVFDYP